MSTIQCNTIKLLSTKTNFKELILLRLHQFSYIFCHNDSGIVNALECLKYTYV